MGHVRPRVGHVRPRVGHVSYQCPTRVGVPLVSDTRTHHQLGVSVLHRLQLIGYQSCQNNHRVHGKSGWIYKYGRNERREKTKSLASVCEAHEDYCKSGKRLEKRIGGSNSGERQDEAGMMAEEDLSSSLNPNTMVRSIKYQAGDHHTSGSLQFPQN